MFGPMNIELGELYDEPNTIRTIKSSRLRRRAMLCEWMERNCLKRYCGQTLEVKEDVADRSQDLLTGRRRRKETGL